MTVRRPRRRTSKGSEALEQDLVLQWLAAVGILAFRMNSGATIIPATEGRKRRRIQFGVPGMADILCFPRLCPRCRRTRVVDCLRCASRPYVLWIEMKSAVGRQTPLQKSFEVQVSTQFGQAYVVARLLEDIQRLLNEV